jgi:RNA polymerase sigma-70 factor (ECF subfamily)
MKNNAAAENVLVSRAREGDEAAFAALVGRYKDRLFNIASSVCSSMPSEADDVAQETFISALKNIRTFRANAAFSTWLYRIAANNCWQRMRKAKTARQVPLPEDNVKGHPAGHGEAALKNELSRAVAKALGRLSAEQRLAVTFCDIEGLSLAEAAARMKVSIPAVKSRLHRARLLLKNQLSEFK